MTSAWLTNNEFPSPEEFSPRILRPTGDVLRDEQAQSSDFAIQRRQQMDKFRFLLSLLIVTLTAARLFAQEKKYPPLSDYMMSQNAEIALAKSAAPE